MHPAAIPVNAHARPTRRRSGWLGAFFAAWCTSITVIVAGLAREGCPPDQALTNTPFPIGWTLRLDLDAQHPEAGQVTKLLLLHGPDLGDRESIALRGDGGSLRRQLQSAGWTVLDASAHTADRPPQLRVIAPDGTIAWTGTFNAADLATPGSRMLSQLVLAEVAQGRLPPPIVPIACAVPDTAN